MSEGRVSWHHVGNRIGGNPFGTIGIDWCDRCKMEVDTTTIAKHRGEVYVYKRTCDRCGKVLKSGLYNAPLLSNCDPTIKMALTFLSASERG